jgi:hypothetical protein
MMHCILSLIGSLLLLVMAVEDDREPLSMVVADREGCRVATVGSRYFDSSCFKAVEVVLAKDRSLSRRRTRVPSMMLLKEKKVKEEEARMKILAPHGKSRRQKKKKVRGRCLKSKHGQKVPFIE